MLNIAASISLLSREVMRRERFQALAVIMEDLGLDFDKVCGC